MNGEDFARETLQWSQRRHNEQFGPSPGKEAEVAQIDPVEFGKLQAEVGALRRDNDRQLDLLEKLDVKFEAGMKALGLSVKGIEDSMTEARGGWKTLVALGGMVAAVSSAFGWVVHEFLRR